MGIGLHPDIWQSRGPHWQSLLSPKMPGAWFGTNAHKQKHKHTRGTLCLCVCMHMCVCVCLCVMHMCVFSSLFLVDGWGWQVLNCAEVERAAMGISRFMMLVRKLTNQSCFLFCSYSVNGAPSCPSCNHPRPTNCTDSVLGSLPFSLPFSPSLSLGVYISLTLSLLWSLLSCQRVDIHFLPDRWNLYFITATYGERYFLPKGKLACNYNVLATPNILYKMCSILFLTHMSFWSFSWHHSVA